jgi:very-short-patch-repair endonuclease
MTKQEFLGKARDKHGYKYKYPNLSEKVTYDDIIDVEYEDIVYKQRVNKHIMLGRCPEKNTPSKTTEQFIKEAKEVWGDKYDYSLVDYKGALKRVKIIYDGVVFDQIAVCHLKGKGPEKTLTLENFIRKAKLVHGDRYDYSQVRIKNGDTPVMIGFEGIFYIQKPYYHLSGSRPENIVRATKKTNKQFIFEANKIHEYKYNYDKVEYIKNQVKVIITCPVHGDFKQTPNSHLQGNGCPNCNESRGEKEIVKVLEKYKIDFIRQKKFSECKNVFELPFDFYIPSKRICIEFDGKQHYEPIDFFGGIKAYESLKLNDSIKNDFCENNCINLIRIKYDQIDNIEKILNDLLLIN